MVKSLIFGRNYCLSTTCSSPSCITSHYFENSPCSDISGDSLPRFPHVLGFSVVKEQLQSFISTQMKFNTNIYHNNYKECIHFTCMFTPFYTCTKHWWPACIIKFNNDCSLQIYTRLSHSRIFSLHNIIHWTFSL